jgi:hypothetical protein
MPKENIPSTGNDVPGPIRDEDFIADEIEKETSDDPAEEEPEEEGGLGPRG